MAIETITIVGVGLIGGSFGLALRAAGFKGRILGVSSSRTIKAALGKGAIERGAPLGEALPESDLVYLSQPISRILQLLPEVRKLAPSHALVTDAGSTKREIVEKAATLFGDGPWFVGGHPMAGKEQRGVELADAHLFQNATYALTPSGSQLPDEPVVKEFEAWVEKIGAKPVVLPADLHDRVVAWTSHLPQLLSTALASAMVDKGPGDEHGELAGPGLRDMTRLAESPYEIWKDILATNTLNVEQALTAYIDRLGRFREQLKRNGLADEFEAARKERQRLSRPS